MEFYVVLVIFTVLQLALSRMRSRKTTEEIDEALGERDTLIQSLRDEITDKFGNCAALAVQAQNAAADAEVQAAQAQLKAASAEGCLQVNLDSKIASAIAAFDGDFNINMGADGSIAVGHHILGMISSISELQETTETLRKHSVSDHAHLMLAKRVDDLAAPRKKPKNLQYTVDKDRLSEIEKTLAVLGRLHQTADEDYGHEMHNDFFHELLKRLDVLEKEPKTVHELEEANRVLAKSMLYVRKQLEYIERKVKRGAFGDVVVETQCKPVTSLRAVGVGLTDIRLALKSNRDKIDKLSHAWADIDLSGAFEQLSSTDQDHEFAHRLMAPLKRVGAIERFRRLRKASAAWPWTAEMKR